MKGLKSIPSLVALQRAYNVFHGRKKIPEDKVILYSHWSRFDPRLGEMIIEYLQNDWVDLNPLLLRKLNGLSVWPQALAVILEHVANTEPLQSKVFEHFKSLILESLKPTAYQSFTIGLFKLGGMEIKNRAINSHPFFKKWGFYDADPMFSKFKNRESSTLLDRDSRRAILNDLLTTKKQITVKDYLEACRHAIHPRQAERDLLTFFKLKKIGNTRGRVYTR